MGTFIIYRDGASLRPVAADLRFPFTDRAARLAISASIRPGGADIVTDRCPGGERLAGVVSHRDLSVLTEDDAADLLAVERNPDSGVPVSPLTYSGTLMQERKRTFFSRSIAFAGDTLFEPIVWPEGISGKWYTSNFEKFIITGDFLAQFAGEQYSDSKIFGAALEKKRSRNGAVLGLLPEQYFELLREINTVAKLQGNVAWPINPYSLGGYGEMGLKGDDGLEYLLTGTRTYKVKNRLVDIATGAWEHHYVFSDEEERCMDLESTTHPTGLFVYDVKDSNRYRRGIFIVPDKRGYGDPDFVAKLGAAVNLRAFNKGYHAQ